MQFLQMSPSLVQQFCGGQTPLIEGEIDVANVVPEVWKIAVSDWSGRHGLILLGARVVRRAPADAGGLLISTRRRFIRRGLPRKFSLGACRLESSLYSPQG